MDNKIFTGAIAILIIAAIALSGAIYLKKPQPELTTTVATDETTLPVEQELIDEESAINQDLADLNDASKDTSLDNLDKDLSDIAGVSPSGFSTALVEKLENEMLIELNSLSTDLGDMNSFVNDTSLNSLNSDLSGL